MSVPAQGPARGLRPPAPSTSGAGAASGAVYDRGYRPYEGPRGGRRAARAALWRLSVRRALGIRRDWRQKVFPWSLLALAVVPALVAVMTAYAESRTPFGNVELVSHHDYLGVSSVLLLFVATAAPDLVCPDRRNRTLPLILSRPLTGDDYVGAKFAALASLVFGFALAPQIVLFVGQMLVSRDGALDYFTDNAAALWQVPVAVALLATYYAAFGLAVSATTSRRVGGSVAILAIVLVSSIVASIGSGEGNDQGSGFGPVDQRGSAWALADLGAIPNHLGDLVFLGEADRDGPLAGVAGGSAGALAVYVAVLATSFAYLRWRYRSVEL